MPEAAISTLEAGKSRGAPENSTRLRVLVVDDEPLVRWSLGEMLIAGGHAATEAQDGAAALRAIGAARFDVVLLDFRLPDSNDLRLLAAIRQRAPETAVVLMTAFSTPEVVNGAYALGARRVLGKPFDLVDVVNVVRAVAPAA